MEGPSRCPLCVSDEENTDHLLLHCSFASEVWKDSLKISLDRFSMPTNTQALMKTWANISLFNISKKDLLKASWMWLPKFIYQKLWIERNNRIFREKSSTPARVVASIRALLGEALEAKATLTNASTLSSEEDKWLTEIVPNHQARIKTPTSSNAEWDIQLTEQDFIKWRSSLEEYCLFFDGASKGNPGASGGGGVILDPGGKPILSYAWGLGHDSNNRAEALSLWKGLKLSHSNKITSLLVFGDSLIIIQLQTRK